MATSIQNGALPIVLGGSRPAAVADRAPARPLFGMDAAALLELAMNFGEKRFRAQQLEQALYRDWAGSLDELSTLPKVLRERLATEGYTVGLPEIVETFRSVDGTERYLIAGLDGQTVETVWMPGGDGAEATIEGREDDEGLTAEESAAASEAQSVALTPEAEQPREQVQKQVGKIQKQMEKNVRVPHVSLLRHGIPSSPESDSRNYQKSEPASQTRDAGHPRQASATDTRGTRLPQRRATICVSSQIGCAVNCQFCLTAKMGIVRNLSAGEIAGQVVAVLKRQGVHLGRDRINLVFMGMGEPFLNYDAWIAAFRLLAGPVGLQPSRMTVSTSGIVPGIERFAQEPVRPKLAISLNASNDAVREAVMPVTRKWNIAAVLDAAGRIPLGPREKITFEYVLLGGVNDRLEHADEVIALVRGARFPAYVNLIVWNPGPGTPYAQPEQDVVDAFQHRLISRGVTAYIRRPRGRDIYAACGQLKRTLS